MKRLIPLLLILALFFGCADAAPETTAAPSTAATEAATVPASTAPTEQALPMAPDFTVYDLQGNPVKLSDFLGTPVVLNFWASWCGPCKAEMPEFDQVCKALEGKVQFLMINLTDGNAETVESASAFIADAGYGFPVFYDTATEAAMAYGVQSIPTTFFITARGEAAAYYTGTMPKALLEQGIAMILPE